MDRNKLYIKRKLYISDNNKLKIHMLQQHYDPFEQRYLSHKIMFQSMQNGYFQPNIAKNYKKYAINCGTCRRTKVYNVQKHSLLNSLSISNL